MRFFFFFFFLFQAILLDALIQIEIYSPSKKACHALLSEKSRIRWKFAVFLFLFFFIPVWNSKQYISMECRVSRCDNCPRLLSTSVCMSAVYVLYPASTCIYYPLPYFSVRFRWIYRVRDDHSCDYSCYPWIDTNISRLYYFYLSDHFQWKKSNHVIRVKSMTRKRKWLINW